MNKLLTILALGKIPYKDRLLAIQQYFTKDGVIETFNGCTNLIIPAKDQHRKIVLSAHYDVYPGSKGYNDNLSGIATLIDLQDRLPDNCEIVITDKEEVGFLGALEYAKRNQDALCNINLDIVGIADTITCKRYNFRCVLPSVYNAVELDNIPFNDSRAFERFAIPSLLVMTGPRGKKMGRTASGNLMEGCDVSEFLSNIWKYQHGGPEDNKIKHLSEDTMDTVGLFVIDLIKELNTSRL